MVVDGYLDWLVELWILFLSTISSKFRLYSLLFGLMENWGKLTGAFCMHSVCYSGWEAFSWMGIREAFCRKRHLGRRWGDIFSQIITSLLTSSTRKHHHTTATIHTKFPLGLALRAFSGLPHGVIRGVPLLTFFPIPGVRGSLSASAQDALWSFCASQSMPLDMCTIVVWNFGCCFVLAVSCIGMSFVL